MTNTPFKITTPHVCNYFPSFWGWKCRDCGVTKLQKPRPIPDIVEKLPEEGEVCAECDGVGFVKYAGSVSQACGLCNQPDFAPKQEGEALRFEDAKGFVHSGQPQAPTMKASDGNEYPIEYWTTQQRFDEVTPPENVHVLMIGDDGVVLRAYRERSANYDDKMQIVGTQYHNDLGDCAGNVWTIAPTPLPAKPKQEEPRFGLCLTPDGKAFDAFMLTTQLGRIEPNYILQNPERAGRLIEYIQHILSQDKGD